MVKKPEVDYSFDNFYPSLWLAHRSFILNRSEERLESETPSKEKYWKKHMYAICISALCTPNDVVFAITILFNYWQRWVEQKQRYTNQGLNSANGM